MKTKNTFLTNGGSDNNGIINESFDGSSCDLTSYKNHKNSLQTEIFKKDEVEEEIDKEDKIPPISFFKLFKYSTWTEKVLMIIGILGAIMTGSTAPLNTLIFGNLADAMIDYGSQIENVDGFLNAVQEFAMYNSILGAIMLFFSYISVTCFNYAAHSQIYRIRGLFFRSVLNQDISWYDFNQSGEFATRMNEDLTKLEEGLGEKVVIFIHFIVAFIGSITLAFVKGWELALVCLSSLPVTFISIGIVAFVTSRLAKKETNAYAKAGNIAEEVLSSIRTVIAFNGQNIEVQRYKENLSDAKRINIKKGFFSGLGFGLLWFFIYASYALAFWYGVGLVIEGREPDAKPPIYTPGIMMTVFFSVMMGSMNLGMASPFIESFGVARGAGTKVYQIIDQIPKINTLAGGGIRPKDIFEKILFKNIYFQYPTRPDVKVLEGINFTINRGETVAFVGSSGCGKSTITQLIQRFYDPISGEICLDDKNIKDLDVNWLREKIGSVGQEPILFGTTIYENIRYGKENATKQNIEDAAKAANAHLFIKKLPNGYDTLVGERGAQLSGGQKQRIAIARALVRNPEILLLDEATSALDTASEAKVQIALEKASEGRTTILIAHRLSTIRRVNKIFVIDNGKIVETGTHQNLMNLKGYYYNLVIAQIGTEDIVQSPVIGDSTTIFNQFDEDEIGIKISPNESNDDDEKLNESNVPLLKIIKLNLTEWPHILTGSISSIIMGFAMPIFAVLFGDILGILSSRDKDYVRSETNIYSLYFVLAGIVVGFATFLQIYTFGIAGEILTERLRGKSFDAMLKQEVAWFDLKSNGTGTLCAKLSTDAAAVQGATGQRIGSVMQSLATLFLGVGLAMYYEWKLGLLALVFTPFILIATYLQGKVMFQENMGAMKAMEKCTKLAVEVVSNVRTVVSLGRERMFYENYMALLAPSVHKAKLNTHYRGVVYGMARSLMFFAFAACMYYGGYLVANENLEYSKVFKVSQALIMGTVSVANALAFAPNFQKGVTSAGKIFALLERKPKIVDNVNSIKTNNSIDCNDNNDNDHSDDELNKKFESNGNVYYTNVEFTYPSRLDVKVLKGLNLNAFHGQTIALVGQSGCGKSTCIQLLERFYDVDIGSVTIDNSDIRELSLKNLREQFGIVSQEPTLFDRTIAENIAYGDNLRKVNEIEIIEAAKKANIHNFITTLPLGYETRLGEKGTQLSGGQKQRIAIARALIRNPKVLLLDEATSALDAESEKIVQEALDVARKGRTCIVIAHRLSTIIDSDVIFVLDSGVVAEYGTHKELLNKRGIYYNLYRLQSGNR